MLTAASQVWLSYWIETGKEQKNPRNVIIFSSLTGGAITLSLVVSLGFCYLTSRGSLNLHLSMVAAVFKSPLAIFTAKKVNDILFCFSRDIDNVDIFLPHVLQNLVNHLTQPMTIGFVICWANPWLTLATIPVSLLTSYWCWYFIKAIEQLKTIENATAAPLYTQFTETAQGITTIRSHQLQDTFYGKFVR